jgi:peptidoglycan/xylan/chitin deacetylase (PgdA/CDA1 family)
VKRLLKLLPYQYSPVLLYHRIAATTPKEDPLRLAVPPEVFEWQMHYLHSKGFTIISLEHLSDEVSQGKNGLSKQIVITFDDGYLDNYTNAFPILQNYGFAATFFIVTDLLGKMSHWDSSPIPLMNWEHVKEMSRYGMSFESHTRTHPNLLTLDDGAVMNELRDSRHELEDILGVPIRHLAYPYGRFDQRVNRLAGMAGYQSGWAAGLAARGCLAKERMQITSGDNQLFFAFKASGWAGLARKFLHLKIWNQGGGNRTAAESLTCLLYFLCATFQDRKIP